MGIAPVPGETATAGFRIAPGVDPKLARDRRGGQVTFEAANLVRLRLRIEVAGDDGWE
jgi:hypothetical protein